MSSDAGTHCLGCTRPEPIASGARGRNPLPRARRRRRGDPAPSGTGGPVGSYADAVRRPRISWPALVGLIAAGVVAWLVTGASPLAVVVAVVAGWLILKVGFAILSSLATPVPAPPPPGELRKVRLTYRCSVCGTEVRMTSANDEVPDPPRHCQEDMDLVAPID
jgi:hypothetical protein